MPEGLIFKKNLENPNQTHFHSFLITRENGSQAYASVLTFYEQVQDPAMLSTLDALQRSFLQTRMVTLNSADNESTFDPNTDKLYAPKCLCFVTCKPVVRPCQVYLEQLHAVTAGGKQATAGLPVESFLYNILYEVPLPSPGKTTKFTGKDLTGSVVPSTYNLAGIYEPPIHIRLSVELLYSGKFSLVQIFADLPFRTSEKNFCGSKFAPALNLVLANTRQDIFCGSYFCSSRTTM